MTNPGQDSGQTASSDSDGGGSEPTSSSYEAPPIEQVQDQPEQAQQQSEQPTDQPAPAYEQPPQPYEQPGYPPPPAYDPSGSPPPYPPTPGYAPGSFPPPDYSGYPPPGQPGYAPPYPDPTASYGAPSYPPPPYGAPPPGYGPPPTGYPAPGYGAPGQKTNTMAIASLVASVVGVVPFLCGVGSIIGIVLGVVALNQIKQTGENGRGLAIAGIAVGAVTFLFSLIIGISVMST